VEDSTGNKKREGINLTSIQNKNTPILPAMQSLYSVPVGIDQQIEALISEEIKVQQYKRSQYRELLQQSELKIQRLQAALNSLTTY
jgi:DNA-binding protein H-NS